MKYLGMTSALFIVNMLFSPLSSLKGEDVFVTVQKRNVTHKFAKMSGWLEDFLDHRFVEWENDTFDVFEQVKDPKGVAIDLGAWIGTTSIWLSNNFLYVIAVEADKESLKYLKKNLVASNCTNVQICEKAVSHTDEPVVFGPRLSFGEELNNSTSYAKKLSDAVDSHNNYLISTLTFNQIIENYVTKNEKLKNCKVSFIKCDIEGGEESILKDILDYAKINKSKAWISFHYDWWSAKNIESFESLFQQFKTNSPTANVSEYIKQNPFTSILFEPKT
jgi:FkbM family methyltransferase